MKLYYDDVLSPRRACAVARYLQSPVEFVHIELGKGEHKTPEYLALNPNGKVPTLVDGTRVLWEADAIMAHLAARADSDLWPQDGRQIEVVRWLSWNLQHFYRHGSTLYFEYVIKPRYHLGKLDEQAVEQATKHFRTFAAVLDAHLAQRRWLVGDTLTIADFAVASPLPFAETSHIPLHEFPAIARWHERLCELDAWREPYPEVQAVA
ncbi:MAG TPA: glutathione S-transferase family protein [Rhodanobacteraceae bacterium]|nr:glutathione S-transferase family protein [Rhodanobacteraceae bacterium]